MGIRCLEDDVHDGCFGMMCPGSAGWVRRRDLAVSHGAVGDLSGHEAAGALQCIGTAFGGMRPKAEQVEGRRSGVYLQG